MKTDSAGLFVGIDVGGTKVYAILAKPSGEIVARQRCSTPRDGSPNDVLLAMLQAVEDLLFQAGVEAEELAGVGLAVPGICDVAAGRVAFTPNMNLTGVDVAPWLEKRVRVPVALGNDVNLGTLGEKWLGAARTAQSVVGIFVGTGIGGGIIFGDTLIEGHRGAAGEIGHIVMEIDGPLCGCGNRGCLEAIASRTAIERDIRAAVAGGRKSAVTELAVGDLAVIRSGMLRKALKKGDEVVMETLGRAAKYLGHACLTVRHLLDPEVIVLGGGVMESCGDFVMPIVEKIMDADALPGARGKARVVPSALGDDAVALGAVFEAKKRLAAAPVKKHGRPKRK